MSSRGGGAPRGVRKVALLERKGRFTTARPLFERQGFTVID